MTCKVCGSDQQSKFTAEIAIHLPGLKGLNKPHVLVFPELLVCLNCGKSKFVIPEDQLRAYERRSRCGRIALLGLRAPKPGPPRCP